MQGKIGELCSREKSPLYMKKIHPYLIYRFKRRKGSTSLLYPSINRKWQVDSSLPFSMLFYKFIVYCVYCRDIIVSINTNDNIKLA